MHVAMGSLVKVGQAQNRSEAKCLQRRLLGVRLPSVVRARDVLVPAWAAPAARAALLRTPAGVGARDSPHPTTAAPQARIMDADVSLQLRSPDAALVDGYLASWFRWREACEDVRGAYDVWRTCARPQRALAFASYRAALDREEHAALSHSGWNQLT
jgi:hypothetical protein